LKAVKLIGQHPLLTMFAGKPMGRRIRFDGLVLSTGRRIILTAGRLRKEIISKPLDNATAEVANLEQ